jgi:hypothetical protein
VVGLRTVSCPIARHIISAVFRPTGHVKRRRRLDVPNKKRPQVDFGQISTHCQRVARTHRLHTADGGEGAPLLNSRSVCEAAIFSGCDSQDPLTAGNGNHGKRMSDLVGKNGKHCSRHHRTRMTKAETAFKPNLPGLSSGIYAVIDCQSSSNRYSYSLPSRTHSVKKQG